MKRFSLKNFPRAGNVFETPRPNLDGEGQHTGCHISSSVQLQSK